MSTPLKKCPICHKNFQVKEFIPFCSLRCKRIDLNRWLNGGYSIPVESSLEEEEDSIEILRNYEEDLEEE